MYRGAKPVGVCFLSPFVVESVVFCAVQTLPPLILPHAQVVSQSNSQSVSQTN